jgi:hypothetical protein
MFEISRLTLCENLKIYNTAYVYNGVEHEQNNAENPGILSVVSGAFGIFGFLSSMLVVVIGMSVVCFPTTQSFMRWREHSS